MRCGDCGAVGTGAGRCLSCGAAIPLPDEEVVQRRQVGAHLQIDRRSGRRDGSRPDAPAALGASIAIDRRLVPRGPPPVDSSAVDPATGVPPSETTGSRLLLPLAQGAARALEPALGAARRAVAERIQRHRERGEALAAEAESLESAGDELRAFVAWGRALLAEPLDATPVRALERIAAATSRQLALAELYEAVLVRHPDHPSAATLRRRAGQLREAVGAQSELSQVGWEAVLVAAGVVTSSRAARLAAHAARAPGPSRIGGVRAGGVAAPSAPEPADGRSAGHAWRPAPATPIDRQRVAEGESSLRMEPSEALPSALAPVPGAVIAAARTGVPARAGRIDRLPSGPTAVGPAPRAPQRQPLPPPAPLDDANVRESAAGELPLRGSALLVRARLPEQQAAPVAAPGARALAADEPALSSTPGARALAADEAASPGARGFAADQAAVSSTPGARGFAADQAASPGARGFAADQATVSSTPGARGFAADEPAFFSTPRARGFAAGEPAFVDAPRGAADAAAPKAGGAAGIASEPAFVGNPHARPLAAARRPEKSAVAGLSTGGLAATGASSIAGLGAPGRSAAAERDSSTAADAPDAPWANGSARLPATPPRAPDTRDPWATFSPGPVRPVAGRATAEMAPAGDRTAADADGSVGARQVALGRAEPDVPPVHARLLAWLVDLAVVAVVPAASLLAGTGAFAPRGLSLLDHLLYAATRSASVFVAAFLLGVLTAFVYLTLGLTFGGRTLGDRIAGLRSIAEDGGGPPDLRTAAVRSLVAIAGTLAFLAGPLWALVDPRGQALHDKVAGTRTVRA